MSNAEQMVLKLEEEWKNKTSLADYSDEQKARNEELLLKLHTERQKIPAELQHYENLKNLAS